MYQAHSCDTKPHIVCVQQCHMISDVCTPSHKNSQRLGGHSRYTNETPRLYSSSLYMDITLHVYIDIICVCITCTDAS